jgi:pimeloyl-ACP methyl ester carboxylesterase
MIGAPPIAPRPVQLRRSGLAARVVGDPSASATTAVFIHGLGCSTAIWPSRMPLVPGMAGVFIDLPGHGRTAGAPASLPSTVARVATALEELGVRLSTILVAHSMGGLVALHLEPLLGVRNRRTMLFATGARFAGLPAALRAIREGRPRWAHDLVPRLLGPDVRSIVLRKAAANVQRVGPALQRGLELLEWYDAVRDLPPLPDVSRVLAYGTEDRIVRPREVARLGRRIGAVLVRMEGIGHFPMIEAPGMFRALCRGALQMDPAWPAASAVAAGPVEEL